MDNRLKCPRCSKSDYSVQNQGGSKNTFFHCKSCGYSASPEAWQKQQTDKTSSNNPFYKKSQKKDHPYNEMYPESAPWNNCKCGRDYQVGINGDSRFCETCLRQEEMKNRIRTKKSPLAKGNPFYKKSQLEENLNDYFKEMKDWLLDIFSDEISQEKINDLDERGLKKAIQKYYDGGLEEWDKGWDLNLKSSKSKNFKKQSQSTSVGDDKRPASDIPSEENNPIKPKQKAFNKKPRKNPERAFDARQDQEEIRRVSMNNPFYKISKEKKDPCWKDYKQVGTKKKNGKEVPNCIPEKESNANPFYKKSEYLTEEYLSSLSKEYKSNPFYLNKTSSKEEQALAELDELIKSINTKNFPDKESMRAHLVSSLNYIRGIINQDKIEEEKEKLPKDFSSDFENHLENVFQSFINKGLSPKVSAKKTIRKIAREFGDRSEYGKKMKEISDENMAFNGKPPNSSKSDSKSDSKLSSGWEFNSVDRNEQRSSPNPNDLIPGFKDWKDKEVDQYYDGWLDHHIENSGGSVPGSNQQKTMNLNDGERAHDPVFPVEAIYEKLLEGRHHFDGDYTRVVANGRTFILKESDVKEILKLSQVGGNFHSLMSETVRELLKIYKDSTDERMSSFFMKYYQDKYGNDPKEVAKKISQLIDINAGETGPVFDLEKEALSSKKKLKKSSMLGLHTVPM